jgi:hypothetical protein
MPFPAFSPRRADRSGCSCLRRGADADDLPGRHGLPGGSCRRNGAAGCPGQLSAGLGELCVARFGLCPWRRGMRARPCVQRTPGEYH